MNRDAHHHFVTAIQFDLTRLKKHTVPAIRQVRSKYKSQLRNTPGFQILNIARALAAPSDFSPRLIAFELLADCANAFSLITESDLETWAFRLADWGDVDLYGCTIVGAAWRSGIITDKFVMKWARSPDRWLRRLSLVATVPLNNKTRGGIGDPIRTLKLCRLHVDDRDDMVVKALSWALRELAKREPQRVHDFVKQHQPRLAPRVIREVGNKLRTGMKNPR